MWSCCWIKVGLRPDYTRLRRGSGPHVHRAIVRRLNRLALLAVTRQERADNPRRKTRESRSYACFAPRPCLTRHWRASGPLGVTPPPNDEAVRQGENLISSPVMCFSITGEAERGLPALPAKRDFRTIASCLWSVAACSTTRIDSTITSTAHRIYALVG